MVAQIQDHKTSATAETYYKVRPLELLRVNHKKIEAWILEQAEIVFDGMNHAFCAKQLGHSIEMFQRIYSKWIDGEQNDRDMDRLDASLSPVYPLKQNKAP